MDSRNLWQQAKFGAFSVLAAILAACSGQGGVAPQSALPPAALQQQDPQIAETPQQVAQAPDLAPDALATATGPIVYVDDINGILWTVNLGNNTIHRVGPQDVILTDLGFDPRNHVLYGIYFNSFYRVSTTTGRATYIGPLGISDANALVFDLDGRGYVKGYNDTKLYAINNVATGRTSLIGSTGVWKSAGDLTFYDNTLVLSGYTGTLSNSTRESIVTLNRLNGAVESVAQTNVTNLYGLASPSAGHLYGFANTSLYRIVPSAATVAQRAVLLKNFAGTGVAQIMGAAYDGNFQL